MSPQFNYIEIEDILASAQAKGEPPFILILDGLEDPRNFGAILRTADAAGVHGVIIPKSRSVSLNETVEKTSTGAAIIVPVARVPNLTQAIEKLKEENIWITGVEVDGRKLYSKIDYSKTGIALVLGSEGKGMSRLVKEHCDNLVYIPMKGQMTSLNVSVSAAILMYEVVRQRSSI
ncbi:MAG: 23S rRNA (guanosine(2251)-2'-O)-methyltransferase RlmB [Candidatus Margulisbacteria bacterium]|nr:23S rRNA (guanosine(2251)-2'-O)-methyltransferase RlmB [Candidatus Margulisiibacteriota bacterium]